MIGIGGFSSAGVTDFVVSLIPGLCLALLVLVPFAIKHAVKAYAEKAVGSVFDKKLEKYKAELTRATMAKEVLLEREMAFYDKADAQIAELVPLIQDLRVGLIDSPFTEAKRDYLARLPLLVIEMKDASLRYQAYIDPDIWTAFNKLVVKLQSQSVCWFELAKKISGGDAVSAKEKAEAGRMCDDVLFLVASVRAQQACYLSLASGEKAIGIGIEDSS